VNGGGDEGIDVAEVLELLGPQPLEEAGGMLTESDFPPGSEVSMDTGAGDLMPEAEESVCHGPQPSSADVQADSSGSPLPASGFGQPLSHLAQIVSGLGGELTVSGNGNGSGPAVFSLSFPASAPVVEQIETLLSAAASWEALEPGLPPESGNVVGTIKEFMLALSRKDMNKAQETLLRLAEQKPQAGLFKEIGGLARDLHTQLRGFVSTLDPALKDMVEERLPDSGNRLEHMLELTEKAATTTLDCVDAIQERMDLGKGLLDRLEGALDGLQPLGDEARKRIGDGKGAVAELREAAQKSSEELDVIMGAQDFQDLTGQIVLKIMQLLKDLEQKLMNVIRTFGVRLEEGKKVQSEELYGPAHKKIEALHSQDDVDALLAEFGF
jgi:chemotaxis protein CheZ